MVWENLVGRRFGRWSVKEKAISKNKSRAYLCVCDCGNQNIVVALTLRNGNSKSCGCLSKEIKREKYTTHGFRRSQNKVERNFYQVWQGMHNRCHNENAYGYKDYGGRGIKVCEHWNKFENFLADMYLTYKTGLTIERKEVNEGYSRENCTWVTRKEQAKNRRSNIYVDTLQGRLTIQDAAKLAGISWTGMMHRVNQNWSKEDLLISATRKGR